MKKKINPTLFRNSIYLNLLDYSNILVNKNVKSLILFQDEEIKKNIIKCLDKYNISVLNLYIYRNFSILNINLNFFKKKINISYFKFKLLSLSKLNFLKFTILNKILYREEFYKYKLFINYLKNFKKFKQKLFFLILSKFRSQVKLLKEIKIFNDIKYFKIKLQKLMLSIGSIKYLPRLPFYFNSLNNNNRFVKTLPFKCSFSTSISNNFKINPFNIFYNKYKYYSILKLKNNFKLKSNFNKKINFKKFLNKKFIMESIKYYNLNFSNLFIKNKLLNILHKYTGYSLINLVCKNIILSKKLKLEIKYNNFLKYTQMFNKYINKYELKYLKTKYLNENIKIKLRINRYFKNNKFKKYLLFLRKFPFYLVKQYKPFLSKIYYYFTLENYDINSKFIILKNSFRYIYKRFNCHFFRAFKFYKSLISKLFRYNLLQVNGIKVIFKGRFGKVRKQISKFNFGSLSLNTVLQKITYFNSLILTQRGSYGFHMWFAIKSKKKNIL